jgi:hypothetical protein
VPEITLIKSRAIAAPQAERATLQLFALKRTLRIRQIDGLGLSTVSSISPYPATGNYGSEGFISAGFAHRLCQLIWLILHNGLRYEQRGPAVSEKSKRARTARMIRTLQMLGYRVELSAGPA